MTVLRTLAVLSFLSILIIIAVLTLMGYGYMHGKVPQL